MKRQRILLLGIAICIVLSCIGCIRFSGGKKTEIPIKKLLWKDIVDEVLSLRPTSSI